MEKTKKIIDLSINNQEDGDPETLKIFLADITLISKKDASDQKIQDGVKSILTFIAKEYKNQNYEVEFHINIGRHVSDKHARLIFAAAKEVAAEAEIRVIRLNNPKPPTN
ncbi:MAG: hypothetical protein V1661_00255 [bacterium]